MLGYINVPKSACTSIKNIIYILDRGLEYPDPPAIHHDGEAILYIGSKNQKEFLSRTRENNFLFSFVRHPYSRAYSCFKEKIASNGKWSYPAVREAINREYKISISAKNFGSIDDQENNFWHFLEFAKCSLSFSGLHPSQVDHWRPQSDILSTYPELSFIGSVENFKDDMRRVLSEYGIGREDLLEKRWNEGPENGTKLSDIMSPRVRVALESLYHKDISIFGYV